MIPRHTKPQDDNVKQIVLTLVLLPLVLACSLTGAPLAATDQVSVPATPIMAIPSPTCSPTPLPTCLVTTGVEGGALNVRACAGIHCPVLQVVHEGDRIEVVSESDGWLNIGKGWVNARFCRKE